MIVKADAAANSTAPRSTRVLFLGSAYAGHATRFANLERSALADPRFDSTFKRVTGWKHGALIERATIVPKGIRGRIRATLEASAFAQFPRPDVVWTSASEVLSPYLWAQMGQLRRPMVFDLDATRQQLEAMAPYYSQRRSRGTLSTAFSGTREQMLWKSVSLFTPWSNWAAEGLRAVGIEGHRIEVIPPGVDLSGWHFVQRTAPTDRPIRLLFVGGDFTRKGGHLLLEMMHSEAGAGFELDIVTRESVDPGRNIRIHHAEFGDKRLQELYERADLFVMPSLAECFGIATIEAMATGLPVIVANRGGAADIVESGKSGLMIEPDRGELALALTWAANHRPELPIFGRAARDVVERKFNGQVNDGRILERIEELAAHRHRSESLPSNQARP